MSMITMDTFTTKLRDMTLDPPMDNPIDQAKKIREMFVKQFGDINTALNQVFTGQQFKNVISSIDAFFVLLTDSDGINPPKPYGPYRSKPPTYRITLYENIPKNIYNFNTFMTSFSDVFIPDNSFVKLQIVNDDLFIAETGFLDLGDSEKIKDMIEWNNKEFCLNAIHSNPMTLKYVNWSVFTTLDRDDLIKALTDAIKFNPESLKYFNWVVLRELLLQLDFATILKHGIRNSRTFNHLDWGSFVQNVEPRRIKNILSEYLKYNWESYSTIKWEYICDVLSNTDIYQLLEIALTTNKMVLRDIRWEQFTNKLNKSEVIALCVIGVKSSNLTLMESSMRCLDFKLLEECYGIDPRTDRAIIIWRGTK